MNVVLGTCVDSIKGYSVYTLCVPDKYGKCIHVGYAIVGPNGEWIEEFSEYELDEAIDRLKEIAAQRCDISPN